MIKKFYNKIKYYVLPTIFFYFSIDLILTIHKYSIKWETFDTKKTIFLCTQVIIIIILLLAGVFTALFHRIEGQLDILIHKEK